MTFRLPSFSYPPFQHWLSWIHVIFKKSFLFNLYLSCNWFTIFHRTFWTEPFFLLEFERRQAKPIEAPLHREDESNDLQQRAEEVRQPAPRVRPVPSLVPRPPQTSLVKFVGNIYTLKCRFVSFFYCINSWIHNINHRNICGYAMHLCDLRQFFFFETSLETKTYIGNLNWFFAYKKFHSLAFRLTLIDIIFFLQILWSGVPRTPLHPRGVGAASSAPHFGD